MRASRFSASKAVFGSTMRSVADMAQDEFARYPTFISIEEPERSEQYGGLCMFRGWPMPAEVVDRRLWKF